MSLSASAIRLALEALARDLGRSGDRGEMFVVGGAALVLLFGARASTNDVDAYFVSPEAAKLRAAAARVASAQGLPEDWLNDGAKGFMVGVTNGELLYSSDSLVVRAVSTPQLLAMKLAAWRDAIDRSDARLLLSKLTGSMDEIWASVEPLVPPPLLDKASYAFQDLWEALHGSE